MFFFHKVISFFLELRSSWSSGSFSKGEVRSSNLRLAKSDIVLPTGRHRPDLSQNEKEACVAHRRNDAKIGPANSLQASA